MVEITLAVFLTCSRQLICHLTFDKEDQIPQQQIFLPAFQHFIPSLLFRFTLSCSTLAAHPSIFFPFTLYLHYFGGQSPLSSSPSQSTCSTLGTVRPAPPLNPMTHDLVNPRGLPVRATRSTMSAVKGSVCLFVLNGSNEAEVAFIERLDAFVNFSLVM